MSRARPARSPASRPYSLEGRFPPRRKHRTNIMRHQNALSFVLALSALAVGCEQQPRDTSAAENRDAATKQLDKVKTETKQAADDMMDYSYARKSEFVDAMKAELAALNRDLDQLGAQIEKASGAAKAEAKLKLQGLRDQAASLNEQLEKGKKADESGWADFKAGFTKEYGECKDGFRQARHWLSDKIAP